MTAADIPEGPSISERIESLRAQGAAARDPVSFAYIEALARRAAQQPERLHAHVLTKLAAVIDELACSSITATTQTSATPASPLSALLAYIGAHDHNTIDTESLGGEHPTVNRNLRAKSKKPASARNANLPELKSVAIFRDAWSRLSTEQQLTQTLAQAPENAGPMNSQHLVLRSLQLMRDIAPEYLQGFMTYVDTLIWLEQTDPTRITASRTASSSGKKSATARRKAN